MSILKEQTPVEKLISLQTKVTEINNKKIGAEKELELLKEQHTILKKNLEEYGITNINELPVLIAQMEAEFIQKLNDAEEDVKRIEQFLTSI